MLFDKEKFDVVEEEMHRKGIFEAFERENGKIKGRMMIDLIEPPSDLAPDIPEGALCFGASFDFYDTSLGFAFDPVEGKARSGLWCTPQAEGAEEPAPEWKNFFDSDEGRAEFEKWKTEQKSAEAVLEKKEKSGEKSPL